MKVEHSRGRKGGLPRAVVSQGRARAVPPVFREVLGDVTEDNAFGPDEADLEMVDRYAAALRESPTMDNLRQYREAIRSFLTGLLRAYSVEEIRGFNRYGRRSISTIVRTVDAKLEELALVVIHDAQKTLEIAARIDDIRGMLLDLQK